jgi:hypothetical protein
MAAALIALSTALAPSRAAAEINVADSLEWMVADAELVVRGVVSAVDKQRGEGQVMWYRVTLRVSETLEGKRSRTVRFVVRHLHGETPEVWRQKRTELLLFLISSKRRLADDPGYGVEPFALRERDAVVRLRARGSDPVYTLDFAKLTGRAEILKAARRAVAAGASASKSHNLDVPVSSPAYGALWSGSAVWLVAPVGPTLEKLGQQWTGSSDVSQREEGVKALAHFRSPTNVALLRKLLADPGFVEISTSNGPPVRRFIVRAAAFETLGSWGVHVQQPVLERPAP